MNSDISTIIIFAVVGYVMSLIYSQSKKIQHEINGRILLRPVKVYKYFAYFCYAIALSVWALLLIEVNQDAHGVKVAAVISAVFLLSGLYLHLFSKRYFVEVSDDKIICQPLIGKRKEIRWSEIVETNLNVFSDNLILKTKSDKVAIYMFIEGFRLVLDKVKSKLSPEVYKKAFTKLDKLKERQPDIFSDN